MTPDQTTLNELKTGLEDLKGLVIACLSDGWVNKKVYMNITGYTSETINTYVSQGKIVKRGRLYSLRAFNEKQGVYGGRKRKIQ